MREMNEDWSNAEELLDSSPAPSGGKALRPELQAMQRLLPSALTDAFVIGITGGSARRAHSDWFHSDLLYWLLPGLAVCGIEATLTPLKEEMEGKEEGEGIESCRQRLRPQIRRSGGACLFAFSSDINKTPFADYAESSVDKDVQESDSAVTETAFVTAVSPEAENNRSEKKSEEPGTVTLTITLKEADGAVTRTDIATLTARFSHVLVARKGTRRPVKATAFAYAVRVWAQFACACPARVIGTAKEDAPLRELAATFWRQMAGSGRSAQATRLRRVADLLEHPKDRCDIDAAFRLLYEMACRTLLLPPFLENALLAPSSAVLSDAERRELIYLARAGTRDVKIFATHRLTFERECADARATLQQLRYDRDAWVRAASQT